VQVGVSVLVRDALSQNAAVDGGVISVHLRGKFA